MIAHEVGARCISNIVCERCEDGWAGRVGQGGERLLPQGEVIEVYWTGRSWVCSGCWLEEAFAT